MLTRLAKVVIVILFLAAGVAGFFLGNPVQKSRSNADEVCRAKCVELQKFHRLAGMNDGPWSCECY